MRLHESHNVDRVVCEAHHRKRLHQLSVDGESKFHWPRPLVKMAMY